jgi:hypothetical protein
MQIAVVLYVADATWFMLSHETKFMEHERANHEFLCGAMSNLRSIPKCHALTQAAADSHDTSTSKYVVRFKKKNSSRSTYRYLRTIFPHYLAYCCAEPPC